MGREIAQQGGGRLETLYTAAAGTGLGITTLAAAESAIPGTAANVGIQGGVLGGAVEIVQPYAGLAAIGAGVVGFISQAAAQWVGNKIGWSQETQRRVERGLAISLGAIAAVGYGINTGDVVGATVLGLSIIGEEPLHNNLFEPAIKGISQGLKRGFKFFMRSGKNPHVQHSSTTPQ